ncbi:MFS transporter [Aeoliella sp. ICT_H6.2]|uniref:MFS transporter n=1 Tax=Aeoliella straminimaris TaxID=2954799 RepID=A0A9X2JGH0_9BACT|nr:MFS transporter [Aeoliella straminimaris]MCO6043558.1 MFS transporter [Aeoliella straminimaris]
MQHEANPHEPSIVGDKPTSAEPPTISHADQPQLLSDRSFWGMAATQFLGAFNDNLFKQLILLLAIPVAAASLVAAVNGAGGAGGAGAAVAEGVAGGAVPKGKQDIATVVFAAAFLLFSGVAGWLADRTSKRTLIIASKVAEIMVMLAGMIGFYHYNLIGFEGMLVVLFFMGLQSAFFGPPKYGILPEAIRASDLPRANGIFLMFTFIAIIFGVALAGFLKQELGHDRIWMVSGVCVFIAVLGTLTSLMVWRVPAAQPGAKLRSQDLFIPGEMFRLIRSNRQILLALLVSSVFWMLGAVVQAGVNLVGLMQLGVGDALTSLLAAMMAVGIPAGCVLGGILSKGRINPRVVTAGAFGMFVCLVLLSLPGGPTGHLLGFYGSIPVLIALGFFTGMFVVPIQVLLQVLPPPDDKGRMIATMNQCNFAGILIGGILFGVVTAVLAANGWRQNLVFGVTAAIMLPIALFYRPEERALSDE